MLYKFELNLHCPNRADVQLTHVTTLVIEVRVHTAIWTL